MEDVKLRKTSEEAIEIHQVRGYETQSRTVFTLMYRKGWSPDMVRHSQQYLVRLDSGRIICAHEVVVKIINTMKCALNCTECKY